MFQINAMRKYTRDSDEDRFSKIGYGAFWYRRAASYNFSKKITQKPMHLVLRRPSGKLENSQVSIYTHIGTERCVVIFLRWEDVTFLKCFPWHQSLTSNLHLPCKLPCTLLYNSCSSCNHLATIYTTVTHSGNTCNRTNLIQYYGLFVNILYISPYSNFAEDPCCRVVIVFLIPPV